MENVTELLTEIFEILREHSHFLDGTVLELVIETVHIEEISEHNKIVRLFKKKQSICESDLLQQITEHSKRVREFKKTQPIKLKRSAERKQNWGKSHSNDDKTK